MDRTIVYPGAIPQDVDILQPQRNIMVALGFLAQAALGTSTVADGLAINQTSPASMSLNIGPGCIVQNSVVDSNAYGSLGADGTDALVKVGINVATQVVGPFTAPGTAGDSQNFLIQAALSETDGGATVLPYYNASNPSQPYSGPNNTGTAQNTARAQRVNIQVKNGTPAVTGSQTTPAPDSGFVGLWVVTIAHGATSLTSANFSEYSGAPFIPYKLGPGMRPGFSNQFTFTASGTFNVPAGVTRVRATVVGGGASGLGTTGTASNTLSVGGGGNSGTVGIGLINVTPGQAIAVTIGAGGVWQSGSPGSNGPGGTSSFGTYISAPGGTGGGTDSPANPPPLTQGVVNGTGFATGGYIGLSENIGFCPVGMAVGNFTSGRGGDCLFGSGGAPVQTTTANGNPGQGYGSGGSGAAVGPSGTQKAGGLGAPGLVIVEW